MNEQGSGGRRLARRRRANVVGGRQFEHRVKVSDAEEARLVELAEEHRVTVARLLVESALDARSGETPSARRAAMAELFGLHRLLGAISRNVNQIAKATNATGEVSAELVATLQRVRDLADRIDDAIDGLAAR